MKNLTKKLLLTTLFLTIPALAGGNHGHGNNNIQKEISSQLVTKKAISKVKKLANLNKIEKSWIEIKPNGIKQKIFSHNKEWIIRFTNKKISDTAKQNLYLFYTLSGKYIAANYTGK